jgi:hypothetical protein
MSTDRSTPNLGVRMGTPFTRLHRGSAPSTAFAATLSTSTHDNREKIDVRTAREPMLAARNKGLGAGLATNPTASVSKFATSTFVPERTAANMPHMRLGAVKKTAGIAESRHNIARLESHDPSRLGEVVNGRIGSENAGMVLEGLLDAPFSDPARRRPVSVMRDDKE